VDSKQRILVGVNDFTQGNEDEIQIPIHAITPESEQRHLGRLQRVRRERDHARVAEALGRMETTAKAGRDNVMPAIMDSVRAYATLGEMCNVLRGVYGEHEEPAFV